MMLNEKESLDSIAREFHEMNKTLKKISKLMYEANEIEKMKSGIYYYSNSDSEDDGK